MDMKRIITFFLVLMAALSLNAEDIVVNGTTRNFISYVPRNLGTKRPLLISCHGMNQDAAYQKGMLQIESVADTAKFVTVFPNGIDNSWDLSGDRDLRFMREIIKLMSERYDIDLNKVYLSGFSMGGMFTYFAMNRMADVFAAFAPISGYPMWGASFTSSRPVPIIHTHGTSDDVVAFSGVASVLAGWVKRNGCPSTATVIKPYRASHITRHVWGPGEDNVEVVLMEMADKGHWIANDGGVKTGEEIWKFCKRFSLKQSEPTVRIVSPKNDLSFVTMGGQSELPDILVEAEASDPEGEVESVSFYDGEDLLAEVKEAPYTCTLTGLTKGEHVISAVVRDAEGYTAKSKFTITIVEQVVPYVFTNFSQEASVPEGWETYDGVEHRMGYCDGFTSGSRVFHFTGSERDFDWGLYTRNVNGGVKEGYARYASENTSAMLTLFPGNYQLYVRVTNWNQPNFSPVTVALETMEGEPVMTETFTPTVNIGNTATNSFSGSSAQSYQFDVLQKGRYRISFYTNDAPWADLVIGKASIRRKGDVSAVKAIDGAQPARIVYYNLSGQQVEPVMHGLYVEKTIMNDGTTIGRVVRK